MAVAALLAFAGCSPAASNSENESGAQTLAEFEGGEITRAEFDEQLQALSQQSGGEAELPSEGDPQYGQLVAQVMPQLLQIEIAEAYAEENDITVTEEDVNEELDTLKGQIGDQARSQGEEDITDEEAYSQALEQAGFTEEELREDIQEQLPVQKVQEEVAGDAGPSDEEVRTFYDENEESFTEPEERCARHILFPPDAEEPAEEAKQELEDGADFAELAQQESQDTGTAEEGGDLGCAPQTDPQSGQPTYAPAFNDALFAEDAEEGDLLGPVETEFGYHIIQLQEIRGESTPPFDEVEGQIRDQLTQEARSERFQEWYQEELERRNVRYQEGYDPEEVTPAQGGSTGGQG